MQQELRTTSDGSHTLYVPQIDECYHSTNGAVQESIHIFIKAALQTHKSEHLNVFEVGFGTGLNALLTLLDARQRGIKVHYMGIERYPITIDQAQALNYAEHCRSLGYECTTDDFMRLHTAPWGEVVEIVPHFTLTKIEGDLNTEEMPHNTFDVVYFDAFSPEKQEEMWSQTNFKRLYKACHEGAIMTTYCAKGVVRRTMQAVGWEVERLPGPPGKRQIIRAIKNT